MLELSRVSGSVMIVYNYKRERVRDEPRLSVFRLRFNLLP